MGVKPRSIKRLTWGTDATADLGSDPLAVDSAGDLSRVIPAVGQGVEFVEMARQDRERVTGFLDGLE